MQQCSVSAVLTLDRNKRLNHDARHGSTAVLRGQSAQLGSFDDLGGDHTLQSSLQSNSVLRLITHRC